MTKTPTYYVATLPDGTIPTVASGRAPLDLLAADADGITRHPAPGKRWFDNDSFFTIVTQPGESLHGLWRWPVRLFIVEPVGETGTGDRYYPYQRMTHALRVVEETDAWHVFGPLGQKVLDSWTELPALACGWAQDWSADPDGTKERYEDWRLCNTETTASGMRAEATAAQAADRARRSEALATVRKIAIDKATRAAASTGADRAVIHFACRRAAHLAEAVLLEDRLTPYLLDTLRGIHLEPGSPLRADA
ncbi:hypothetical protein [Streptomyces sp. NPDC058674]|uniref:hypothetical protein n=1 Tax=Streptomyces sp. NPDC058674 TaxID=3346592 RepID=UPI003653E3D4